MTTDEARHSVMTATHREPEHRPAEGRTGHGNADPRHTDQDHGPVESPEALRRLASARRTRWGVPSW